MHDVRVVRFRDLEVEPFSLGAFIDASTKAQTKVEKYENHSVTEASTADSSSLDGDSSMSSIFSAGKIYGRAKEEKILKEAFDRISKRKAPRNLEYILISGSCGVGKTRLGESIRCYVERAGGFFCSGKYDQNQDDPFAPLCAAFNDYVRQVLNADDDTIQKARRRIRSVIGNDLWSLSQMIPPLSLLMRDDLLKVTGDLDSCQQCSQKQGRSLFALHKLMRAICSPDQPVVMMLDDIQWASRCPLEKLRDVIIDDMNEGIMFLGICRDDVGSTEQLSPFLRTLEEDDHVNITNISISNLRKTDIEEMVKESFLMPEEQSNSLASFVFSHSHGNAYFAVESLRMLQQESRLLKYDGEKKTWLVNHDIADRMMDYCPQNFIEKKLQIMPRDIQKVFVAASCLGCNITERLLEIALQEPLRGRLQELVKKGEFRYNENRKAYSFRHNLFQSVCYDLIADELKPAFHLEIGLRLKNHLSEDELERHLFLVLNQLKQGASLIRERELRYEVATLCIRAAEKAAAVHSFSTASDYLRFGFKLLRSKHWEEAYDLSLILYNYAAEVEFAQGDSGRVDYLIDEVLSHANSSTDKLRAYSTKIYVLGVRGKMDEAIAIGVYCLQMLDVNIKSRCNNVNLLWSIKRISARLRGKSDSMLKRIPHMTDTKKLAAMQILNMLFLNTFLTRNKLFPFVVFKMMKLTLQHGMSAISSVAFAGYGHLLCLSGKIEEGLRYGKLALDVVEEWDAHSFRSRVGAFVWGSIFLHAGPVDDSLEQLKEGHRLGLQTGDTEFAMLNAHLHTLWTINAGKQPMSKMIDQYIDFKEVTALHGHRTQFDALSTFLESMKFMASPNGCLSDHFEQLEKGLAGAIESNNWWALSILYNTKHFFYFAAGDYKLAVDMINNRSPLASPHEGTIYEVFGIYLDGLTFFGEASRTSDPLGKRKLLKRGRACMRSLKLTAKINPSIGLGKLVLLEAESAAAAGLVAVAEEKYEHAIALAAKYGCCYELSFANQRMGEHYANNLNKKKEAISYFKEACNAYEAWEAIAVADLLRRRINELKSE